MKVSDTPLKWNERGQTQRRTQQKLPLIPLQKKRGGGGGREEGEGKGRRGASQHEVLGAIE